MSARLRSSGPHAPRLAALAAGLLVMGCAIEPPVIRAQRVARDASLDGSADASQPTDALNLDGETGGPPDAESADAETTDADPPPLECQVTDNHDEDGDGLSDACDNCPEVSNPGQEDLGEASLAQPPDGIGDACDPEPLRPNTQRILFDPFTELSPERWIPVRGGNWVQHDDAVDQVVTDAAGARLDLRTSDLSSVWVRVHYEILAHGNSPTNAGVALGLNADGSGWLCSTLFAETARGLQVGVYQHALAAGVAGGPLAVGPYLAASSRSFVLDAWLQRGQFSCGVGSDTMTSVIQSQLRGAVALRTNRVAARFDSVTVYSMPP